MADSTTQLCSLCRTLPSNLFRTDRNTQCTLVHCNSYLELKVSGENGCDLCKLFLHAIQKQSEDVESNHLHPKWTENEAVTIRSSKFDGQFVQIGFKDVGSFRGRFVPPEWIDPIPSGAEINGDAAMPVIKYWLNNCHKNHKDCAGLDSAGFIPTRLVDVGGRVGQSDEPRLILSTGMEFPDPRYLALSHCWGLTMPASSTTTLETMSQRLKAIPMSNLSKTFSDFIKIARRIRIQYVWIDSLCIIQNSVEDWEKEAAQMASVYSNAHCTISASGSANGNGGCRTNPRLIPYGPVALQMSETDESDATKMEKVRVFSIFGTANANVLQSDPLTKRGWTFQERELSPRIIHYSGDTIRWECSIFKASLRFPWDDTLAFNNSSRTFDASQIGFTKQDHTDLKQRERNQAAWFDAVLNYTGRALTKQSDKLPAISGIARAVHARTNDRYLAGLWESNLVPSLLWASAWYDSKGFETHLRHPEYLAPSWSWASVSGQVRYEYWIFHALHPSPDPRFVPTVMEAQTSPAGSDAFGQLKAGYVRLKGRIKPALIMGEGFARQDRETVYDTVNGTTQKIGDVRFDVPSEIVHGRPMAIVCLCMYPREERLGDAVGLALTPADGGGQGAWKRIGLVFAIKLDWYAACEERVLKIV